MELRDLNPANKLPFIKSSNKKIIILLSVVAVLFGVGLYANLYGASKRKTTDRQLHEAREKSFEELEREIL